MIPFGVTGERQLPATDQLKRTELMSELLQTPVCEKHGCEKVWINDRSNRNGGLWRCRECNNEGSRRRNARNRANPEKTKQIQADARRRYNAQPQEKKDSRNQQIRAQRAERFAKDPVAKEVARLAENARQNAARANLTDAQRMKYREENLRKMYGIGHADYERMLEEQGGGCAICGSSKPNGNSRRWLHVDHCHETGLVRGVLCSTCNSGLGSFGDDIGRLEAAVLYLKRHGELGTVAA